MFNGNKLGIIQPIMNLYYDYDVENNYLKIRDYYFVKHNINPEEKNIFYCSEEEVESRIKNFVANSIEKVNKNLDVNLWFKEFNVLYPWAERINKKNLFNKNKIEAIMEEYAKAININESLYEIIDRTMPFSIENEELQKYYKSYKNKIAISYFSRIVDAVKKENKYNITYLDNLFNIISNSILLDESVIRKLVELIVKSDFFIPDINGDISESQWRWCHIIWEKCSHVDEKYKMREKLYDFSKNRMRKSTKIGKYRIDSLNKQYHIIKNKENNSL